MLSESEIEAKIQELCQGDGIYVRGPKVQAGRAWEIILKAPELRAWEAFQMHKDAPGAQFAFIQSMNVWCSSDAIKVPDAARDAFTAVQTRYVGVAEAIGRIPAFQRFVGLEADTLEK